jgi:aryl-alcohol dehydrogenase-like predicted oxidoreductase
LSNFTAWQIQKYVDLADLHELSSRPITVQPQYSLLARAIEWEIAPACEAAGLGLLPWSPLASGWLTGKYRRGEGPADGTRLKEQADEGMKIWNERGHLERNWHVLDVVHKLAEQRGTSMGQIAIAWVLARPAVTSVILGARTLDQLNDNLSAADVSLSDDEMHLLDDASEPDTPDYPYGEKGQMQRSRRISGGRF